MKVRVWAGLYLPLVALLGCSGEPAAGERESSSTKTEGEPASDEASPTASPETREVDAQAKARKVFDETCAVCHGETGKGDGNGAASLEPKPRDFTDSEWQASVTDTQIEKTILGGGLAVGKSPVMPATPQLKSQPEVLDALVEFIRSAGNQG